VAARFKSWTVSARSNDEIVESNPTEGRDVCVRLFSVRVGLCVGSGLVMGLSRVQEVLSTVCRKRLRNWRRGQDPTKGGRSIDEWMQKFLTPYISDTKKRYKFKYFSSKYNWIALYKRQSSTSSPLQTLLKTIEEKFASYCMSHLCFERFCEDAFTLLLEEEIRERGKTWKRIS
jgi:hypothetical protein